MAYELGRGLGAAGVTVVSGLALGIDAAAHRGCLDAGGPAIGVLAGGPDVPYPRSNAGLYERLRRDGIVVSELPPGVRPFRWTFPARNRIMAGLSAATVVVEAADPSGLADHERLRRSRWAGPWRRCPGRATARLAAGANRLLKDGALVVTSAEDVLDELFGVGNRPDPPARPAGGAAGPGGGVDPRRGRGGDGHRRHLRRRGPAGARGARRAHAARGARGVCGATRSGAYHPAAGA